MAFAVAAVRVAADSFDVAFGVVVALIAAAGRIFVAPVVASCGEECWGRKERVRRMASSAGMGMRVSTVRMS